MIPIHLIGHLIEVRFFDHSIGSDGELIECSARGKLMETTPRKLVLEYWSILNQDKETEEHNREQITIIQKSVVSFIEYAPKRAKRFY